MRALVLLPCILLAACTGGPDWPWVVPDPSATPVTGPPAFGLAWFHKPPQDGTTAATLAANSRYIHLTGPSDAAFRTALRQAGFQGPIYTYTSAMSVEGPGPYKNAAASCTPGYTPRDNTLAWRLDDFCTSIASSRVVVPPQ